MTGAVAVLAAVGLAAYPAAQDIRLQPLSLALAVVGVFVLALGVLARWPAAIGFGLVSLGGTYAVLFAAEGSRLDRLAPGYAAGLLLVAAAAATGTGGLALESLGVVAVLGSLVLITVLVGRWAVDE